MMMLRLVLYSIILFLVIQFSPSIVSVVNAISSPWQQTNWSAGDFSSSSNVTTSTSNQVTLSPSEKLTNTGFESDISSWNTGGQFSYSGFLGSSGAVVAWPMDDSSSTQYVRSQHPSVSTGRNMILNSTPSSATSWSLGANWAYGSSVFTHTTGSTATLRQTGTPMVSGKVYSVTYTVTGRTAGTITVSIGNSGTARSANGTYTETLISSSTTLTFTPTSTFDGSLSDFSVTQLNIPSSSATYSQLLTDGDMETSGTSSWSQTGATISKSNSSPHGGSQALKIEASANLPHVTQSIFVVGNVYRITGYARSDGTNSPRVSDGSVTSLWSGTTSSTWQAFDIVFKAQSTDIDLRFVASGTGYVEFDDVVVSQDTYIRSGEVGFDQGFETWSDTSTMTNWSKTTAGTSTLNRESSSVHGGTYAARLDIDGSNSAVTINQDGILVKGKTYTVSFWAKSDAASGVTMTVSEIADSVGYLNNQALTNTYTKYSVTFVALDGGVRLKRATGATSHSIYIDDISIVEVSALSGRFDATDSTKTPAAGGATSGHLDTGYTFDGTNDSVAIYSSDLNSAFNQSEGTVVAWAKVSGSGIWTDTKTRRIVYLQANFSNGRIDINKNGINNRIVFNYVAGGTTSTVNVDNVSSTDWMQVALTWSKSSDEVKAYVNAVPGTTQTGLGTWAGNFSASTTFIGQTDSSDTSPWSGMINDVRIYNRALSGSEITALYTSSTRNTSTAYNSSAGSAKVVSPADETTTFTQSVNVSDTRTYNLEAYAYTTGSAVTSSDVSLYANGSTVTTSYSSVAGGWYKLSGTVTGVASAVSYGVQVAAGKTVYLDNFSLFTYESSGTLTSSVFDSGQGSNWGTLSYAVTSPSNTTTTVKVRTASNASMSGAPDFSACSGISSGSDVSSNSCVTDGNRYAQYQIALSTTEASVTPTFTSFSLPFSASDVTAPTGLDLQSPGDNSYTKDYRPTFRWKTASDSDTGVSKYQLIVKNNDQLVYSIDNIPVSGSEDYVANKYTIHFENFSDSDTSNDYISLWTKDSSDWAESNNFGKLKDGKNVWTVQAVDGTGNVQEVSHNLYIDTASPVVSLTKLGSINFDATEQSWFYKILNPALIGKLSEEGEVTITFDKKGFNTTLPTLYGNFITTHLVTDKSGNFTWTPSTLEYGNYKVTVAGKDMAGNSSNQIQFTLLLSNTYEEGNLEIVKAPQPVTVEPSQPIVNSNPSSHIINNPTGGSLPSVNPTIFQKVGEGISNVIPKIASGIGNGIGSAVKISGSVIFQTFTFVGNIVQGSINLAYTTAHGVSTLLSNSINSIASGISNNYNTLALGATGIMKDSMLAIQNGVNSIGKGISSMSANIRKTNRYLSFAKNAADQAVLLNTRYAISSLAFTVGEKTQDLSAKVGFAIVQFGYQFVNEPTTISNVKVIAVSKTSATISWTTNHPANGKVNYGLSADYGLDVQSEKKVTYHEFTISNLNPNTTYYYEVMSHNKNYVYDANHTFITPGK